MGTEILPGAQATSGLEIAIHSGEIGRAGTIEEVIGRIKTAPL